MEDTSLILLMMIMSKFPVEWRREVEKQEHAPDLHDSKVSHLFFNTAKTKKISWLKVRANSLYRVLLSINISALFYYELKCGTKSKQILFFFKLGFLESYVHYSEDAFVLFCRVY